MADDVMMVASSLLAFYSDIIQYVFTSGVCFIVIMRIYSADNVEYHIVDCMISTVY